MEVKIKGMNLSQIADSGQCFRWKRISDETYEITAYDRYLRISGKDDNFFLSCDEREWKEIWYRYFDMDTDYEGIGKMIMGSQDDYLKEAYACGSGIRILNQDLWETLVSFIISLNTILKM